MPNDLYTLNGYKACVPADFAKNGRGRGVISICTLFMTVILLSGCALPMPIQAASWAIDGISYLATNKSIMDHGISTVSGRDCATFRIVTEGNVCRDIAPIALGSSVAPAIAPIIAPVPIYTEVSEVPSPLYSDTDGLENEVY
jgi:hypothetical protein